MNILYLHTHDTGREARPYSNRVETPNLKRLSDESAVFTRCFSTAPTCSPSRAGLLTGTAPHFSGMLGLAHRGFRLKDPRKHLVSLLRSRGFEAVLSGIQHEAAAAEELFYDKIISADHREMDRFQELDPEKYDIDNALRAAEYFKTAGKPFFLSYGMFATHREFPVPSDPGEALRVSLPAGIEDTQENRLDFLGFRRSARIADDCVGIVLDGLERSGLADDTLVLFTTDHGMAFPGMKCTLYDAGIGVACMLKYPGNPLRGRTSDALVSHLDILPTIFDLLGLPPSPDFQGRSLRPILEGTGKEIRDCLFAEVTYHAAYEPMRCIRTNDYKYIRRFDDSFTRPVLSNIDDCPAKTDLIRDGYSGGMVPAEEFYDLRADPGEKSNRISNPVYGNAVSDLKARLSRWMTETGDPLLAGPVPLPRGAIANKRACISPSTPDFDRGS